MAQYHLIAFKITPKQNKMVKFNEIEDPPAEEIIAQTWIIRLFHSKHKKSMSIVQPMGWQPRVRLSIFPRQQKLQLKRS